MNRYKNVKITEIDRLGSRQKLNTTIYKNTPILDSDIYVLTQAGDRLDSIASQFYKDSTLWWYIARANGLNDINVPAGVKLRLPANLENASTVPDKSSNDGRGSY